jgi:hypothetical protein
MRSMLSRRNQAGWYWISRFMRRGLPAPQTLWACTTYSSPIWASEAKILDLQTAQQGLCLTIKGRIPSLLSQRGAMSAVAPLRSPTTMPPRWHPLSSDDLGLRLWLRVLGPATVAEIGGWAIRDPAPNPSRETRIG